MSRMNKLCRTFEWVVSHRNYNYIQSYVLIIGVLIIGVLIIGVFCKRAL